MRSLGLKIALLMAGALVVSGGLVLALLPLADYGRRPELAREWASYGLELARAQLAALPPSEREAALVGMRPSFSIPLFIEGPAALRARLDGADPLPTGPTLAGTPDRTLLVLPLDGSGTALVAGPMLLGPSAAARRALPLVIAILVAALGALFVALPLTRRLRRLERATRRLERGELSARADVPGRDVVAELASSFNAMAARIETLFRQREEMLQALAHEISTPLARMRFQLEAVESAPDPVVRGAVLAAIDRELTLLDGFSAELASWIDADGRRPELGPVDLSVVLQELADQESLGRTAPELTVDCDVGGGLIVRADARQLQRALENVVRNALRYARQRVVLRARAVSDGVRVEIADDGPGIPAADRARVLEPFARLEPSRSRSHGGMGLGLAIAQRVVTAHGGSLRIDAAPEGGAAIVFHWPR